MHPFAREIRNEWLIFGLLNTGVALSSTVYVKNLVYVMSQRILMYTPGQAIQPVINLKSN